MLLNARRARRAATVFLTAAFGVPVFAADGVIGTWMAGAGPSAKTYVFRTHDNTVIGTVCGPCDATARLRQLGAKIVPSPDEPDVLAFLDIDGISVKLRVV